MAKHLPRIVKHHYDSPSSLLKRKLVINFAVLGMGVSVTLSWAEFSLMGEVRVIDGDTLVVNEEKIRLYGIDVPEMKQVCYREGNGSLRC
jgi:endonuclease YncB( thermonuclease family)